MSRADIVIRRRLPSPYPGQKSFHCALHFIRMTEEDQVACSLNRYELGPLELFRDVRPLRASDTRSYAERSLKRCPSFGIDSRPFTHKRGLMMY